MTRRKKKYLKLLPVLLIPVLAVLAGVCYCCASMRALKEEIQQAKRDPETGIILGTGPRTLKGQTGRACLLIHGWLGCRICFNELPERLQSEGLTVRMMLLPGHGTTPLKLEKTTAGDYMKAVKEEFEALDKSYREVTVIGFSLGGVLAALLASEKPLDRLVLIAPSFDVTYKFYYVLTPETWNSLLRPFIRFAIKTESFIRCNRKEARKHIFSYEAIPTQAAEVLFEVNARARDPGTLKKINCPVLLLHSKGDMAASPQASETAFQHIGSSDKEAIWFERSNHQLLWDYEREEAAEAVVSFITGE